MKVSEQRGMMDLAQRGISNCRVCVSAFLHDNCLHILPYIALC